MTKKRNINHVQLVSTNKPKSKNRIKASSPEAVYKFLRADWNNGTINLLEEFKLMSLDRQLRLTAISTISRGGTAGTVVDLKVLFATALLSKANRIIIAHNHPSGCKTPSSSDISLTRNIEKACEIMDIPLIDHIIVTDNSYYSFQENELIDLVGQEP